MHCRQLTDVTEHTTSSSSGLSFPGSRPGLSQDWVSTHHDTPAQGLVRNSSSAGTTACADNETNSNSGSSNGSTGGRGLVRSSAHTVPETLSRVCCQPGSSSDSSCIVPAALPPCGHLLVKAVADADASSVLLLCLFAW
jgi:hypothetical protein